MNNKSTKVSCSITKLLGMDELTPLYKIAMENAVGIPVRNSSGKMVGIVESVDIENDVLFARHFTSYKQPDYSISFEGDKNGWISVSERLPEKPEYDWVLVQIKMVPEGWYGVPHVAELRDGIWYDCHIDEPMEKELSVEVTHWMPLPDFPDDEKLLV